MLDVPIPTVKYMGVLFKPWETVSNRLSGGPTVTLYAVTVPAIVSMVIDPPRGAPSTNAPDNVKVSELADAADVQRPIASATRTR